MNYTRNENFEKQLLSEMMESIRDETRQHPSITDLIYCLTQSYYKTYSQADYSDKTKLMFTTGLALEKVILSMRQTKVTHGSCEDIFYHIDSLEGESSNLIEFKSTRAKPNTPDKLPESWMRQIMSYLYTQKETECTLAVLHLIQPVLQAWDLKFEQWEIDENWKWLLDRKEIWDQAVIERKAPEEFKYNMDWECSSCQYVTICESMRAIRRQGMI